MSVALTWIGHASVLVALVAAAAYGARVLAPGAINPATRYCLWWATMAAVLALPGIHALWPVQGAGQLAPRMAVDERSAASAVAGPIAATGDASASTRPFAVILPDGVSAATPWLLAIGVGFIAWRVFALVRAASFLRRARARCRPLPWGLERQLTGWMAVRATGRQARLLVSPDLTGPAVLGPVLDDRDPIIALPAWTIERLDAATLDLIVLHEHAHVERGDDRDLLVQATIEALFCWHPAVAWIGRRLDEERERACDDVVVRRTGRAAQYARCLVGVAELDFDSARLGLACIVGRAQRRLTARVERLLAAPVASAATLQVSWIVTGSLALVATAAVSAATLPRLHVSDGARVSPKSVRAVDVTATPPTPSTAPLVRASAESRIVTRSTPGTPRSTDVVRIARRSTPDSSPLSIEESGQLKGFEWSTMADAGPQPMFVVAPVAASPSEPTPAPTVRPQLAATAHALPFMTTAAWSAEGSSNAVRGPWKRTADVGVSVGQGAADAGTSIGQGAADAGESIGRGAAHAGVKTAGFFSRMGRGIARSF